MSGRPDGAGAVMADRARGEVEADSDQVALWRRLEFFPTPPWAARAGGELITRLEPEPATVWEPCCGQGHMAHGLGDYFEAVAASDIHDHGWPGQDAVVDFFDPELDAPGGADWIVTNPPFGKAAEIVEVGLRRARRGVALLARASLLESAGRFGLMFGDNPLRVFAPFIERVPMQLGGWDPKGSTATAYAWFIWVTPEFRAELVDRCEAADDPVIWPVPPGTKARLTKRDDARLFGVRPEGPDLFSPEGEAP